MKNRPTQWRETQEENQLHLFVKKLLKQVIKPKGKINRLIDEKPSNPVGTKEENLSAGGVGYYVFALLF